MDNRKKAFAIRMLRRNSLRWPPRSEAKNEGREKRVVIKQTKMGEKKVELWHYMCAKCSQWFRDKEIHLDHIKPVVDPIAGFTTFDDFIDRLLVSKQEFQRLCLPCHAEKSVAENSTRHETKVEVVVEAKPKKTRSKIEKKI